jgi:hypothetical protein
VNLVVPKKDKEKEGYGYEMAADLTDLLLSIFELTAQSEDIYFDINQRVISIFSRYLEGAFAGDRNSFRCGCEVLRAIFCLFGYSTARS